VLSAVLALLIGFAGAWYCAQWIGHASEPTDCAGANASLMHLRVAMRLADAGQHAGAESAFARAIECATGPGSEQWRAPSDEQAAYLMRGEARFASDDFDGAEGDFVRAAAIESARRSPDGLEVIDAREYRFLALLDRALLKIRRHDLRGAETDLTSALAAIPDYSRQRLHWLQLQMKQSRRSARSWLEYLERRGQTDGYYRHLRGVQRMWDGDLSGAIDEFDASMRASYAVSLNLQYRAACKLFLGDRGGAQADFQRANELSQNPGMLFFFRGVLRQIRGDCEGALADYAQVVRLAPVPRSDPPGRRSAITTIYHHHEKWFAAAASTLPNLGNVAADISAIDHNRSLCDRQSTLRGRSARAS